MYETIPVWQLDSWLERGYDGRIIDLRDAESFRCFHLYTAENYPYEELMEKPSALDGEKSLLFYCSRGSESMLACNYYFRKGYEVYNLGGGFRFYEGKYGTGH